MSCNTVVVGNSMGRVAVQTCLGLAVARNVAYYTNFWFLAALAWLSTFMLAPVWPQVQAALTWSWQKSAAIVKVCTHAPTCAAREYALGQWMQTIILRGQHTACCGWTLLLSYC